MEKRLKARVVGMGAYLPEKILSNADLEKLVDTSDEWIFTRTGMKERRIAAENEFSSDMGTRAGLKALESAKMSAEQIDLIVCCTQTPDYIFPSTACLIQDQIKALNASAFDIQAACSGFIFALATAKAYLESGLYKNILVVAPEKLSSVTDYQDRSTCVLFGDGAAAAVVSSDKRTGLYISTVDMGVDGSLGSILFQPAGGSRHPASETTIKERSHTIKMEGNTVFRHAVTRIKASCTNVLKKAGLSGSDIAHLVPHQANIRIIDAVLRDFSIPKDRAFITLHKYGNTSSSSVGIALTELLEEKELKSGDHLLLTAFGGGLTWGSAILTQEGGNE